MGDSKYHITEEQWARIRQHPYADVRGPKDWPADVLPLSVDGASLFGIGANNSLYWDGRQLEIRRTLKLEWWQTLLAAIAAVGAFASGIVDLLHYLGH